MNMQSRNQYLQALIEKRGYLLKSKKEKSKLFWMNIVRQLAKIEIMSSGKSEPELILELVLVRGKEKSIMMAM